MQNVNSFIEYCLEGPSSIFKGLNQKDKNVIIQHHVLISKNKRELLFKEGEKSRGLVCLASGRVKLFKIGVGGREQILKMLKPQDFFGYESLLGENIWPFSSAALEDTTFCVIEKQSLLKILKKNADLSMKLNKVLSEELCISFDRITSLTQKHVRGRLVESLLLLIETYGFEEDGKTINAYLLREDIAHLSNMIAPNAIRTLSSLTSEGYIETKGKKIKILDLPKLKEICEQG